MATAIVSLKAEPERPADVPRNIADYSSGAWLGFAPPLTFEEGEQRITSEANDVEHVLAEIDAVDGSVLRCVSDHLQFLLLA